MPTRYFGEEITVLSTLPCAKQCNGPNQTSKSRTGSKVEQRAQHATRVRHAHDPGISQSPGRSFWQSSGEMIMIVGVPSVRGCGTVEGHAKLRQTAKAGATLHRL